MKKIDTIYWKEFRVGDLFDIHPTKAYKLTNAQLLDGGETPVVVNSAYNNGIGGYSTLEATEKGNMITFSDTVDANTIFYQNVDFIGYPHVQGMYPIGAYKDMWSPYALMFFASLFRKAAVAKGFDYGNKFRRDIAIDIIIKLPSRDGSPDWQYMEEYMRRIEQRVQKSITILKDTENSRLKIDHVYWKEFKVSEIFEISRPGARSATEFEEGDTPFVASGNENNGVEKYVDAKDTTLDKKGCISVSPVDGSCFYQPADFVGRGGAGSSIILLRNDKLKSYNALYICSVLRRVCSKYNYSNMGSASSIKNEKIKLPATPSGDPDWHYMEMYMRGVEAIVKNKLSLLIPHKQELTIQDAASITFNGANVTYIDNSKTYSVEK